MVDKYLVVIASLLCITSGDDINSFVGGWSIALTFPNPPQLPVCDRLHIAVDPSTCTCNGTAVPVTTVRGYESPFSFPDVPLKFPTIVVKSPDDVVSALMASCECEERHRQQVVFRLINENCFVQYEQYSGTSYNGSEPHANLLVKKPPKTQKELEASCKTGDLEHRVGHLICPSMFSS